MVLASLLLFISWFYLAPLSFCPREVHYDVGLHIDQLSNELSTIWQQYPTETGLLRTRWGNYCGYHPGKAAVSFSNISIHEETQSDQHSTRQKAWVIL